MAKAFNRDVPRIFWYWLMPVPFVIHLTAKYFDTDGKIFHRWIESEWGFIENGTVLLLIPAAVFMLIAAWRFWCAAETTVKTDNNHSSTSNKLLAIWFFLGAMVCIGFAGEEASWGQHWVGWESPQYFAEHNRQGETNVHNLNKQLGRVVKTVLTIAIIAGGLILPLSRGDRSLGAGATFLDHIQGTGVCIPAALFVFLVRLVERCKTWFDLDWPVLAVNLKESQELYIAIFLFVYAWSIKRRTDLSS